MSWRQAVREQFENWQALNLSGGTQTEIEALLLQGFPLQQGLKWLTELRGDLSSDEINFIQNSELKAQKLRNLSKGAAELKKMGLGLLGLIGCLFWLFVLFAIPVGIWAWHADITWSFAAKAAQTRLLYRIPLMRPDWIPAMQTIPAGSFWMGCSEEEVSADPADKDEQPRHQVNLKSFQMGLYEIKMSEYSAFYNDITRNDYQCKGVQPILNDNGWKEADLPAIYVSWDDAQCYAQWLSFLTATHFYLPSEAQWEYAARAGTTTPFYWGSGDPKAYGWFNENKTQPVGQKAANAFGLYDMSGNVREWVQDCGTENYNQAPHDGSAWEAKECPDRVQRGGSWNTELDRARSAFRGWNKPDDRDNYIGFRLAQD